MHYMCIHVLRVRALIYEGSIPVQAVLRIIWRPQFGDENPDNASEENQVDLPKIKS